MKKLTKLQQEAYKLYQTGITKKWEDDNIWLSFAYYQESYHSPRYYSIKRDDIEVDLTNKLYKYISETCDCKGFSADYLIGYNTTRKELKRALKLLIPKYLLSRKAFIDEILANI